MKPLLTIFIPTYNRADLLDSALAALAPQIRQHHPEVELVVADNASPDHTAEVIARWQTEIPMTVVRNAQNLGFYGNLFRITRELAQGEFAWMVGDDDLVRPDGVARVLAVLREHRNTVDYVYVNTTILKQMERLKHPEPVDGTEFELLPTKCPDLDDYPVADWQMFIDPKYGEVFLGGAILSVFRLSLWQQALAQLNPPPEQNTAINYFNTEILAHAYKGRPSYYIGYPCTVSFRGVQDWVSSMAAIPVTLLQDLLDGYLKAGVDPVRVETCRRFLLESSVEAMQIVLENQDLMFRDRFSLRRFLWQNRKQNLLAFMGKVLEPHLPVSRDKVRDYGLTPAQILPAAELPLITVIVYGQGDLSKTLASLRSYPNLQTLVVGQDAASRNEALQQAQADYIALVQAGAVCEPERLAVQVSYLHHYPEVALCYSAYRQEDETIRTHEFAGRAYFTLLKYGVDIHPSTVMLRRGLGTFDEALGSQAEADLWLRIARNHALAMTTTPLVTVCGSEAVDPLRNTHTLMLWNKVFAGEAGIGWRYKRQIRARYTFEAVRELYRQWPDVPLTVGQVWRFWLGAMWYTPGRISNPHMVGLLVRLAFPKVLYERLRPLWQSVLRS